jgi:hypothetical protein
MSGPFAPRPGFEPAPADDPFSHPQAPPGPETPSIETATTAVGGAASTTDALAGLPQRGGRLLAASFDLLSGARSDLRRASLYIGLIVLLTAGPFALLVLGLVASGNPLIDASNGSAFTFIDADRSGMVFPFAVGVYVALAGYLVAVIEGQALAIVLLGGRLAGRPIILRAALSRSRVVFWRLIRGGFIVQAPLLIVQFVLAAILTPNGEATSQGATLLATGVATLLGLPFAYLATGIVLGDVGAVESIRRSIRIVRTRLGTAFVVALFAAIAQYLLVLGLGVGGDILVRIATPLRLDPSGGAGSVIALGALLLVFVSAFGTLLFTVSAIEVAPQVVAFLALTRYTGGLDRVVGAREGRSLGAAAAVPAASPLFVPAPEHGPLEPGQPEPGAPQPEGLAAGPPGSFGAGRPPTYWVVDQQPPARFRWLTRPLLAGAGLGIVASVIGLVQLANG